MLRGRRLRGRIDTPPSLTADHCRMKTRTYWLDMDRNTAAIRSRRKTRSRTSSAASYVHKRWRPRRVPRLITNANSTASGYRIGSPDSIPRRRPTAQASLHKCPRRDVREYATMSHDTLDLVAFVCGAVGMFGLGMKTSDKFWRSSFFVLGALNTILVVSYFLF